MCRSLVALVSSGVLATTACSSRESQLAPTETGSDASTDGDSDGPDAATIGDALKSKLSARS